MKAILPPVLGVLALTALQGIASAQGDVDLVRVHLETLDALGDAGMGASLTIDPQDVPHISYFAADGCCDTALKLAHHDVSGWVFETVASGTGFVTGAQTSLARDGAGDLHIAYYDAKSRGLKYVRQAGAGFQPPETVDGGPDVGLHCSLALDASGNPHIAYYDVTDKDLRYASKSGGLWTFETVDSVGDVGQSASLVLDGSNHPRVSYFDATAGHLRYAQNTGASWSLETVDASPVAGLGSSLALDQGGEPAIAYLSHTSATPKIKFARYAHKNGNAWTTELVGNAFTDSTQSVGASLAFDATGRPNVAFYSSQGVQYRFKDAGQWKSHPFTNNDDSEIGNQGSLGVSLTLASDGSPRIAYESQEHRDLKYYSLAAGWLVERVIDDPNSSAQLPSLALHDGAPSISFGGSFNLGAQTGLYVATRENQTWSISERIWPDIDASAADSVPSSLQLNSQGLPRVSFYANVYCTPVCQFFQDLMFAWFDGNAWTVETVASAGDVGSFNVLVLDPNDTPSIVFLDQTNQQFRVARRVPLSQSPPSPWQVLSPALDLGANTLQPSAIGLPDGSIVVSHQVTSARAGMGELHIGTFNGAQWSDELVDDGTQPSPQDVGAKSALAYDAQDDRLTVVYTGTGRNQYAYRDEQGLWHPHLVCFVGADQSRFHLALGLHDGSWLDPRIAVEYDSGFVDVNPNTTPSSCGESVDEASVPVSLGPTAFFVDDREHVAYSSATQLLRYANRSIPAPPPPAEAQSAQDIHDFMTLTFSFCAAARGPLGSILAELGRDSRVQVCGCQCRRAAVGATSGKRALDLTAYCSRLPELQSLMASDPVLLADTYGVMQSLQPGRDAVLESLGGEVLVTQDMVREVKAVLDTLHQQGSPELQADIDDLYTQYHDLQDFTDKTFNQAADMVGIDVPGQVGLPGEPVVVLAVALLLGLRSRRARRADREA